MGQPPSKCPSEQCLMHTAPVKGFLRKKGFYKVAKTGQIFQRYQCCTCGTIFTNKTGSNPLGHRRDISKELFGLICSGTTIRRAAQLLDVSINTVRDRMLLLAEEARIAHAKALTDGTLATNHVQFDEMQTFLHSRAKPLTIALAVREKTGQILSAKVGRIPAFGHLAKKGAAMGWTINHGPQTRKAALEETAKCVKPYTVFVCDGAKSYPAEIFANVPNCTAVDQYPTRIGVGYDPLFRLNHVCAKIRADIACMARDTWTTTKDIKRLQDRLDIYVAWNNGYRIA